MIYEAERGNIRFALAGDSQITRPMSPFKEPGFLALVDQIRGADVALTNAEILFHDFEDAPTFIPGGSYVRASPKMIGELQWMGFNMLAGANNHNYDYGENGLLTHLKNLESSGVPFAGIGRTLSQAREARYLDTPAGRVGLVSITTSGPQALYAQDQWRDGKGRPGANMIRYTIRYTVDRETFGALRRMREDFDLLHRRLGPSAAFRNHSWGASDIEETDTEFFLPDLHDEWQYPAPNGYRIALGDRPSRQLIPDQRDVDQNLQRIRDARRMADWVVVSVHNHERGATLDDPSDMVVDFAHAAVDAGADVFHGHGPHRDRGIEIYKGKPIFYSLAHFIWQLETTERQGLDSMIRQGFENPWEATPADLYDARSGREWMGEWQPGSYGTRPEGWRDVIALVDFKERALDGVHLQPVDLGTGLPRTQRGRPVMAGEEIGKEVLSLYQQLSEPFGTTIEIKNGVGIVHLDGQGAG